MTASALLEVEGLRKWFPVRSALLRRVTAQVKAVDDVSFTIARGSVVGLVGESGSGKTTLGRLVLRLIEPSGGSVWFDGQDVRALSPEALRRFRQRIQIIFQDPFASLNPFMRVGEMLTEPLEIHGIGASKSERSARAARLLGEVGLHLDALQRFPHEFSGGQRQRIGIARALAVEPEFIVADEAVSALDVSIQAQVVNLLEDLKERHSLTLLFIAHDLAVVSHIADVIIVMYLGKVMEIAPREALFEAPHHPYSEALLSAVPVPDPDFERRRIVLKGDIPSPMSPPSGCVFRTRCRYALPECASEVPPLREVAPGHHKACIRDDILP